MKCHTRRLLLSIAASIILLTSPALASPTEELYKAIESHDLAQAKAAIAAGADIHANHYNGPLSYAIYHDSPEIVKHLLSIGADANGVSSEDRPLVMAAIKNDRALVNLLISKGARLDLPFAQVSPLQIAVYNGDAEMVKLFLSRKADPNHVTPGNSDKFNYVEPGLTTLTMALEHPALVPLLLQGGADPYKRTEQGDLLHALIRRIALGHAEEQAGLERLMKQLLTMKFPIRSDGSYLALAAEGGNSALAKRLLALGAPLQRPMAIEMYGAQYTGLVPLSQVKDLATLKVLLAAGANPLFAGSRGPTPLAAALDDLAQYAVPETELKAFRQAMSAAAQKQVQAAKARVKGLKAGAPALNALAPGGWTALHFAIAGRDLAFARQLLGLGADPNFTDLSGYTPLHLALRDAPELVKDLLAHKADPHRETSQGTPLMAAIFYKRPDAVTHLLAAGARPGQALSFAELPLENFTITAGETPLLMAITMKQAEIVKTLLAGGADPNQADAGAGPLHRAAYLPDPALSELLLAGGAKANLRDSTGSTPMMYVLVYVYGSSWEAGGKQVLERLLAAGANPLLPNDLGDSPFAYASASLAKPKDEIWFKQLKVAEPLLRQAVTTRLQALAAQAQIPDAPDADGLTPLMSAVIAGDAALTKRLLEAGHDPNRKGPSGHRPLHLALYHPELVTLLISRGAEVNAAGPAGTPLLMAVKSQQSESIRLLLAAGADANTSWRDPEQKVVIPLLLAIQSDDLALVRALLAAGADPNAPLRSEEAPSYLHMAMYRNKDIFAAMVEAGADPTRKADGPSVLEMLSDVRLSGGILNYLEENRQALRAKGYEVKEIFSEQIVEEPGYQP